VIIGVSVAGTNSSTAKSKNDNGAGCATKGGSVSVGNRLPGAKQPVGFQSVSNGLRLPTPGFFITCRYTMVVST
jgi:hypothetical protein